MTSNAASNPARRPARAMIIRAVLLAALIAAATVSAAVALAGQHNHTRQPHDFSWFAARTAPASWQKITSPTTPAHWPARGHWSGCPRTQEPSQSTCRPAWRDLIYLDATPRQGEETLPGWPAFRIAHLRNDNTTSATVDAHAENLPFLGATGSCILDDYVTRVGAHHYREIACLLQGAHAASVLVAATPAADWDTYRALLEQAVAAYSIS